MPNFSAEETCPDQRSGVAFSAQPVDFDYHSRTIPRPLYPQAFLVDVVNSELE